MIAVESKFMKKAGKAKYLYSSGGAGGVLFYLLYKLANYFADLLILRVFKADFGDVNKDHLGRLEGYRSGFFAAREMRPYADDPDNDLSREFLDYAHARGDVCFAIFEGSMLVNYCWYSQLPTVLRDDLYTQFRPDYFYRYKGFTRPSHRGRRLSAYNSAELLHRLAQSGKRGFIGCVEANNLISYRAQKRKKHTFIGFIVVCGSGSRSWIWRSAGVKKWSFELVTSPELLQQQSGTATQMSPKTAP